ncbi:hypothetical protein I7I51_02161 [Histoplasma capsulatum]|uniref:Uncharacterized protein n=1 Tax=Ajellomyces capsulatus TaxID=5037 RepID=A0A8A1MCT1_AJECA|nr:hypothetical protein I7I51_02161 [Histoplasma capsulatum]
MPLQPLRPIDPHLKDAQAQHLSAAVAAVAARAEARAEARGGPWPLERDAQLAQGRQAREEARAGLVPGCGGAGRVDRDVPGAVAGEGGWVAGLRGRGNGRENGRGKGKRTEEEEEEEELVEDGRRMRRKEGRYWRW